MGSTSLPPLLPRRSWRALAVYAVVSLALAFGVTLPWMSRNHGLTGRFPLIGTHGPESVWAANNAEAPRATELDSSYDFISERHEGTELDVTVFQYALDPSTAVRRERLFRETATSWMRANPGVFARMSLVRLGRIWGPRYHPMRWGELVVPGAMRKDLVHRISHTALLVIAVVGLLVLLRRRETRRETVFLLAVLLTYSLAHCVGAGYSRVRFPLDPILAVLAAGAWGVVAARRQAAAPEVLSETPATE